MKIKLLVKNAVITQSGDTVEIVSTGVKQTIDIDVTDTKTNATQERRIYVHDKDEQTKIWMC
jgi:hypothetical protein